MNFYTDGTGTFALINSQTIKLQQIPSYLKYNGIAVYEVIRVINGLPLFVSEHFERFSQSVSKAKLSLSFNISLFISQVTEIITLNQLKFGNIKIVYYRSEADLKEYLFLFVIKHNYPSANDYLHGVKVITYGIERQQPNVKLFNNLYKKITNSIFEIDKSVSEILLINDKCFITEGSKSNVFFIVDNWVITPPLHAVLPGITRRKIIELCKIHQIPSAEKEFHVTELPTAAAAFISGTSPKILPIRQVDDNIFFRNPSHKLILQLQELYDEAILTDLKLFTTK